MITQKIYKEINKHSIAVIYYSLISDLNNLGLTKKDIELLAFTAIRGGINNPAAKQEFCTRFNTNLGTIYNVVSKLTRKGILLKKGNKVSIHPSILLDFNQEINLNICLKPNQVI
jgi:exopolyphosphatase/pppGpp-phosphohydrolase